MAKVEVVLVNLGLANKTKNIAGVTIQFDEKGEWNATKANQLGLVSTILRCVPCRRENRRVRAGTVVLKKEAPQGLGNPEVEVVDQEATAELFKAGPEEAAPTDPDLPEGLSEPKATIPAVVEPEPEEQRSGLPELDEDGEDVEDDEGAADQAAPEPAPEPPVEAAPEPPPAETPAQPAPPSEPSPEPEVDSKGAKEAEKEALPTINFEDLI